MLPMIDEKSIMSRHSICFLCLIYLIYLLGGSSTNGIHWAVAISVRNISSNTARCSGGICLALPTTARPSTSFEPNYKQKQNTI